MEVKLRYGCNPHQTFARILMEGPFPPLRVLNGTPSYVNMLDALGAWQVARELKEATGRPGAASYKHVSPAGAAVAKPLSETLRLSQMIAGEELSPVATAYARARGGDRMSSFGDVGAVSDIVDESLAKLLKREVSDGIIAPAYEREALEILKTKRNGSYLILEMDPGYDPPEVERRELFGFTLEQSRNDMLITADLLSKVVSAKKEVPAEVAQTLLVSTIALKYTQSNSVCLGYDGQVIGIGAGQQSRIHCTRLACQKAEKWLLQQHPRAVGLAFQDGLSRTERTNVVDQFLLWDELSPGEREAMLAKLTKKPDPLSIEGHRSWIARFDGIVLSSDAYIPFRDTIDRASRAGVRYVLQPGGSIRDDEVTRAADSYGMVMIHSGVRLFLH